MLRICFLFITPPVAVVQTAIYFTCLSSVSSSKLGLPAFLKVGLATLHLAFVELTVVLLTLYLAYLGDYFFIADAVPLTFAYMSSSFLLFQEQSFATLLFDYTILVLL